MYCANGMSWMNRVNASPHTKVAEHEDTSSECNYLHHLPRRIGGTNASKCKQHIKICVKYGLFMSAQCFLLFQAVAVIITKPLQHPPRS